MGFTVVRDAAGTAIPVRIGGVAPTAVEQQRIDRFLAKRNATLPPPPPPPPPPEPGFFGSFGREAARGYGTTLTSLPGGIAELAGLSDNDPRNTMTGRLSDTSTDYINRQLGAPVDNLGGTLGNAFGSIGAYLTAPLALAAAGVSAPIAAVGGAAGAGIMGILSGADQMGRDVDATAEANGTPIGRDDRTAAVLTGAATGSLEMLPVHRIIGPLVRPVEELLRGLPKGLGGQVIQRITNALGTGGIEAAQEVVQNVTNDLAAQRIYDPSRDPLSSAYDSIVGAGGSGAIVQILADAVGGRRAARFRRSANELAADLESARRDAGKQAGYANEFEAGQAAQVDAQAKAAGLAAATPTPVPAGIAGFLPKPTTIYTPPPGGPPKPPPVTLRSPDAIALTNARANQVDAPLDAPEAAKAVVEEARKLTRTQPPVEPEAVELDALSGLDAAKIRTSRMRQGLNNVDAPVTSAELRNILKQQGRSIPDEKVGSEKPRLTEPYTPVQYDQAVRAAKSAGLVTPKIIREGTDLRHEEADIPGVVDTIIEDMVKRGDAVRHGPADIRPTMGGIAATPDRLPDGTIRTFSAAEIPYRKGMWWVVDKKGQPIVGQQFESKIDATRAAIEQGLGTKNVKQLKGKNEPGTGFAVLENAEDENGNVIRQAVKEGGFTTLAQAQERAKNFLFEPDAPVAPTPTAAPATPAAPAIPEYAKALRERMTKVVGKETTLKILPLIQEGLQRDPDGKITGFAEGLATTEAGKAVVKLAKAIYGSKATDAQLLANLKSVMDHEMIHALKSLGKITPKEWNQLVTFVTKGKRKGKTYTYLDWAQGTYKDVPGYNQEAIVEEAVAEAFRDYASGYRPSPVANGIFARIIKFVRDIGRAFRKTDAANAQSIFEGIEGGALASRPASADKTSTKLSYREGDNGQADTGRGAGGGRTWAEETEGPVSSHPARLPDLPENSLGPNPRLVEAARSYLRAANIPERRQAHYVKASRELGKKIADAYDAMAHAPNDPQVRAAYEAMARETVAQYQAVKATGLKIEAIEPGMPDPYPIGPTQVHEDLRNGHLWFFPTESGFGQDAAATIAAEAKFNPLLAETDEKIGDRKLLVNDIFRIVHDVFGHGREGVGFGASGEENTWQSHVRMYSPLAAKAMTSETRGQNSWVNYGPYGEANRTSQKETVYADQKLGILPDWVMTEGLAPDMKGKPEGKFSYRTTNAPVFFSGLGRFVEESKTNRAPGQQWIATFKNAPGLNEELEWSGLREWLSEQTKPVTKEEIVSYLRDNDTQVNDIIQGSATSEIRRRARVGFDDDMQVVQESLRQWARSQPSGGMNAELAEKSTEMMYEFPMDMTHQHGAARQRFLAEPKGYLKDRYGAGVANIPGLPEKLEEIVMNWAQTMGNLMDVQEAQIPTSSNYSSMTLPGGENYRQIYLTLPGNERVDTHFTHINDRILAHARYDERVAADGKKVLFVNEVQSDWHQNGSAQGYDTPASAAAREARLRQINDEISDLQDIRGAARRRTTDARMEFRNAINGLDTNNNLLEVSGPELGALLESMQNKVADLTREEYKYGSKLEDLQSKRRELLNNAKVPNAPFKQSWPLLTMKRLLREAAEQGHDYLAWPARPGAIASIEGWPDFRSVEDTRPPEKRAPGGVRWIKEDNDDVTPIVNRYIRDLPKMLGKYVKKWGVEPTKIDIVNKPDWLKESLGDGPEIESVWAIPITDQMRESVLTMGQPRFSYKMAAPMGMRVPPGEVGTDLVNTNLRYGAVSEAILKLSPEKYKNWVQGKVDSFLDNFVDDAYSVGQLIDYVRDNGGSVAEAADVVMKRQLFAGRTGEALEDAAKDLYRPMNEAVAKIHATQHDVDMLAAMDPKIADFLRHAKNPSLGLFELYLYARHAPERNAVMRIRNPLRKDGTRTPYHDQGSGMTDDMAARVMSHIESSPFAGQVAEAAARHDAVIASTNSIRLEKGLVGPEMPMPEEFALAGLPDGYKFYTPLRGVVEEDPDADPSDKMDMEDAKRARTGRGLNIRGREDPTATGRVSMGADLVAHVMLQNEETIIRGEKNAVLQSFLKLLRDNEGQTDGFATIVDEVPMIPRLVNGKVQMMADSTFSGREDVVNVKVDGKKVMIQVHNLRVLEAFKGKKGVGAQQLGTFMNGVAQVGRFLAALRTTYSPEFALTNPFRDFIIANVNMSQLEKEGMLRNLRQNMPKAMKVLMAQQMGKPMDPVWEKNLQDYRKAGGTTQFYGLRDLDMQLKALNKTLDSHAPGLAGKGWHTITRMKDFVEKTNYVFENATRLASFQAMRDLGFSDERAAQIGAKSSTTNFNRGGHYKAMMNAWYLFFNASIGGTMTLAESATRSPRVRKILAGAMIAGLIQDAVMSAISDEDDDGTLVYDKIPDWILAHNFVLPWGNERGYVTIPLPYGFNAFYNFGRGLAAGIRRGDSPYKTAGDTLSVVLDTFNPIGGASNLLNFVAPTIADPIVDLWGTNIEEFSGRPIYPESSGFGPERPKSQLYWNNTAAPYKSAAEYLSWATGGEGTIPGAFEVSPNQLEYAFQFLTGASGTFVQRLFSLTTETIPSYLDGTLEEITASDIPLVRRFIGNVTTRNDMERFIETRDQILMVRREVKEAREAGDAARIEAVRRRFPVEYRLSEPFNRMNTAYNRLLTRIREIERSRASEEDKLRMTTAIRKQMSALVTRSLRMVHDAEEAA